LLKSRVFDVMRIDGLITENVVEWWVMNCGRKYDWLYYIGYGLQKAHIQNPLAYTCNEAVIEAVGASGVALSGRSPSELSKDKNLKYIATVSI
jgi:hypothetical protein